MSFALLRSGPVARCRAVNRRLATRRRQEIKCEPARVRSLNKNPHIGSNYHIYPNADQLYRLPTHRGAAILMP